MQSLVIFPVFGEEQACDEGEYDMVQIIDSAQGKQDLESELVDLTGNEEHMMEATTENREPIEIQPHVVLECNDNLQLPTYLFEGMDYLP